jgi:hypothetical protein
MDQRAYVAALVRRYGESARFVQVFNEPDQVEFWAASPGEFVEQFRYTRDEIREFSPTIPIVNGGYAFADEKRVEYFVGKLREWIDLPAYHSHGDLAVLRETFSRMKRLHREAGYETRGFLNTETGFDAWRPDQEKRQAQALAQKVLYCWANDHEGVMLFCGRMAKGPGRTERDLGLLDYEFCPRFSYAAVGGLVSVLAGATFERTLRDDGEEFLYLFRRGEDRIVAGFSFVDKGGMAIASDAREVIHVDPMGNRTSLPAESPVSPLLERYPNYWILRGASFASLE